MEGRNHAEVARLAGLDQSLVSKWRSGHTPTRLQERTRKRLASLIGSTPARDASEHEAQSEVTKYALSTLRMIQRQAQAIVDNAIEAQRVLSPDDSPVSSPSIEQAATEAEVLLQLPALPPPVKKKQQPRRA